MQKPTIHGYEILSMIAEGGMSTVWKARQTSLDRLVALKVLNKGLIKSDTDVERFRREARAAAHLHHSGLCQIYDAGEAEGTVYYVMEYVAGFSVADLLSRKGDLPEKQALMIAYGVASVLGAIWEKNGIIHCDVKPDNILIDQDGAIRITDLGVARIIGNMVQQIDSEYIVGTPNYASPEQARGVEDLDCRTDIYGLGATLYHMLTGLMPFADSDGEQAMDRQVSDYVADPQKINPGLSISASWLVEKMMVKDRNARYTDWNELLRDMEEVRAGRLPRGQLPPAGQSTVTRSDEREADTLREMQAMKPKTFKGATDAGGTATGLKIRKKAPAPGAIKPRLKTPVTDSYTPRRPAGKSALAETLQKTFYLALLVGGAYGATFYMIGRATAPPEPAQPTVAEAPAPETEPAFIRPAETQPAPAPEPEPEPERPSVREPAPEPEPSPEIEPMEAEQPAPREPTEPDTDEAWDHPDYVEAMRLLREADAAFQEFLSSRDQDLLASVEPKCRKAIELLEAVRDEAPARAQVGERIRQSYQLIHNSRQSRMMGD